MSQRHSNYERTERDRYETPAWVTAALLPHVPSGVIFEPAAGNGKMVRALREGGRRVVAADIETGQNFLEANDEHNHSTAESAEWIADIIVTNPPYSHAKEFIEQALRLTEPTGFVAMLLRTDYDHAKTRAHLFDAPFAKKLVLRKRIVWFEDENQKAAPSFNHAWFIWDWLHKGAPTIAYSKAERQGKSNAKRQRNSRDQNTSSDC